MEQAVEQAGGIVGQRHGHPAGAGEDEAVNADGTGEFRSRNAASGPTDANPGVDSANNEVDELGVQISGWPVSRVGRTRLADSAGVT